MVSRVSRRINSANVLGIALLAAASLVGGCGGDGGLNFQPGHILDGALAYDGPGATGGDGSSGGGDGPVTAHPGTLRVAPDNASVTVSGSVAGTLDFQAFLGMSNGTEVEVTSEASFTLNDHSLGSFSANHFTSATDHGGATRVQATARGVSGDTPLTVRLETVVVEPGAPANAGSLFGGADDASRAPTLVYPSDGVLVPPNLNVLEFHFLPGDGNNLFELTFQGQTTQLRIYTTCTPLGAGCVYTPGETTWNTLSNGERGQVPVTYTLRAVDSTNPGSVGTSASQTIGFGEKDITGGLYYWNAGAGSVRRYDFGLRGQSAENFMDQRRAGATQCVGCHVLSRDGKKIAVGLDIPSPSEFKVFDVATRTEAFSQGSLFGGGGANFYSFSPDGSQMMTSNAISIVLRDAQSGTAITDPLVDKGAMPDWSPDGSTMVYARPQTTPPCFGSIGCGAPGVDQAGLELMTFDGATWSDGGSLVPYAGKNSYYPTFSPDANWVLFNQSPSNANSYDAKDAQVWVVKSTAGSSPLQLATASTGGDSWPKWAPDVQRYRGGSLMWFTFSSRRAYGLRTAAGATAQLWMAAFDPQKGMARQDGSLPAFWLPFQEADSGNHIAQWVTKVERAPCFDQGGCSSGESCQSGYCIPDGPTDGH
jgi:hypothetical protein